MENKTLAEAMIEDGQALRGAIEYLQSMVKSNVIGHEFSDALLNSDKDFYLCIKDACNFLIANDW